MKHRNLLFYILMLLIILTGCNNDQVENASSYQPSFVLDTAKKSTLIFGFPSFSYSQIAAPLINYLNTHSKGIRIKMKACSSYSQYLNDLKHHKYDLTLINGIEALEAENNGYSIFGKVMNDAEYTGVIFINKNAGIKTIKDVQGKTIALAPHKTVPGTMMPLYFLYEQGIDVDDDIVQVKVTSFESAIIATYAGKSDAGVCLKRSWEVYVKNHPEILTRVELKWESPHLINNALLFNQHTNPTIQSQLSSLLFSMQQTADGKEALSKLQFSGFEKANSATYKPMKDFKTKFDSVIHL